VAEFFVILDRVWSFIGKNKTIQDRSPEHQTESPPGDWLSIKETDPGDIFVVGYPKSGNTWMQYLLAGLGCGIDARLAPDSLVQELIPDMHSNRFYRRHLTPMFFKTHQLPQRQFRKVIYLSGTGEMSWCPIFII
jgi:hypothetical protein